MFISLRAVSNISSPKSSTLDITSYVKRMKDKGHPYVAMSDYMSIVSANTFLTACKENNMTPVYGVTLAIYNGDTYDDMLFIARNKKGYHELASILDKETITWDDVYQGLTKENFILLIGHDGGFLERIHKGKVNEVLSLFEKIKDYEFYLELAPGSSHTIKEENDAMLLLRDMYEYKCVISNTVYCEDYESDFLCMLSLKNERKELDKDFIQSIYYPIEEKDIEGRMEFSEFFTKEHLEEAIRNVDEILSKIERIEPISYESTNKAATFTLYQEAYRGLKALGLSDKKEYVDRLNKELYVISKMGYDNYFLQTKRIVDILKDNNVVIGPGRGSAVSSLVAYVIGITAIDPLRYGLLFERFLDFSRKEMPDFDIDVESRDKAFYALLKAKDAPHLIIPRTKVTQTVEPMYEGKESYKVMTRLTPHVSACVLVDNIPKGKWQLTAAKTNTKEKADKLFRADNPIDDFEGVFKIDLLESGMLKMLNGIYKKRYNEDINWSHGDKIKSEILAPTLSELFMAELNAGLFQIGTEKHKELLKQYMPSSIEEFAMYLAIIRRPMLESGVTTHFIRRFKREEKVEAVHPIYDEITKDTYGCLLFQEQVMKLIKGYGMSLTEGLHIVKKCAKKEDVSSYRDTFVEHATRSGCPAGIANKIFSMIEHTSSYCFNYAHAIAYAHIVDMSASLKSVLRVRSYNEQMLPYMEEKGYKEKAEAIRKELARENIMRTA